MTTMENMRMAVCVAAASVAGVLAMRGCGDVLASMEPPSPSCGAPPAADIRTVEQLFGEPGLGETTGYYPSLDDEEQAMADKFNQQLPDNTLLNELEMGYTGQGRDWQYDFSVASAYLAQFGITLEVAGDDDDLSYGAKVPTRAELESDTAKYELLTLLEGFRELPFQFVRATGVRHLLLAAHMDGFSAYALGEGDHDTYVADITTTDDPTISNHEMYHLLDAAECGGPAAADNDPAYSDLAGHDIYTGHDGDQQSAEVTVEGRLADDWKRLIDAETLGGLEELCKLQGVLMEDFPHAVAWTDYGLTNVGEDKADLGANIGFPGDYYRVLDPRTPIIKKKFELIMARLYDVAPATVRYFAAISTRPYVSAQPEVNCTE